MPVELRKTLHTLLNVTASGEGVFVRSVESQELISSEAEFYVDVTAIAGTAPTALFSIVALIGTVEFEVATTIALTTTGLVKFTNTSGLKIFPDSLKVLFTLGGTVTDLDAVIYAVRM